MLGEWWPRVVEAATEQSRKAVAAVTEQSRLSAAADTEEGRLVADMVTAAAAKASEEADARWTVTCNELINKNATLRVELKQALRAAAALRARVAELERDGMLSGLLAADDEPEAPAAYVSLGPEEGSVDLSPARASPGGTMGARELDAGDVAEAGSPRLGPVPTRADAALEPRCGRPEASSAQQRFLADESARNELKEAPTPISPAKYAQVFESVRISKIRLSKEMDAAPPSPKRSERDGWPSHGGAPPARGGGAPPKRPGLLKRLSTLRRVPKPARPPPVARESSSSA